MSIYQPCVDKMVGASQGDVTPKEAEQLLRELVWQAKRKDAAATEQFTSDFLKTLLDEEFKSERIEKLQNKRMAQYDMIARQNVLNDVAKWENPTEGLVALLTGNARVGKGTGAGGMNSISAVRESMFQGEVGQMLAKLQKENLLGIFKDKRSSLEIMRELWKIGQKPEAVAQMPKAAHPNFTRIAEIIGEAQSTMVNRANRAGALIGSTPGYIMKQTHDMIKVRTAGGKMGNTPEVQDANFAAWKEFTDPKLDWEKIQQQQGLLPEEHDKFLRSAWEAIASGVHLKPGVDATGVPGMVLKRGSAMQQAHRKLQFKDADSFYAYNEKFGGRDLQGGVVGGIRQMADQITMMEKLGPNAQQNWDAILDQVKANDRMNFRDGKGTPQLTREWNYVSNQSRVPQDISLAKWSQGLRCFNATTSLGSALLSHINDLATAGSEYQYQGINPLTGVLNHITGTLAHMMDVDRKTAAWQMGLGLEYYLAGQHGHISSLHDFPGMMSKAQGLFFRLNGEAYASDAEQSAAAMISAQNLGSFTHKTFDALPSETQRLFRLYDIKPEEWEQLRQHTTDFKGAKLFLPDAARSIDDEFVAGQGLLQHGVMSDRTMMAYRDGLESKIRNLYIDRANTAVLRPDGKTMALWQGDTKPGTFLGEFMRLVGQFKAYPTAMLTRVVARDVYGREGTGNSLMAVAGLAAATTITGYASICCRAIASGQTPPDPTKPKVMIAAMTRGGGLGLFTDYLFAENGYGHGLAEQFAGPTINKFGIQPITMMQMASSGQNVGPELSQWLRSNVPGQNLFYLKGLFDYLVFNHMNEMLNPGYLERKKKRMEEQGQKFFIPPS